MGCTWYLNRSLCFQPNVIQSLESHIVRGEGLVDNISERVERQVRELLPTNIEFDVKVVNVRCGVAAVGFNGGVLTIYIDESYLRLRYWKYILALNPPIHQFFRGRERNFCLRPLNEYYMGAVLWHEHGHIYHQHIFKHICLESCVAGALTALCTSPIPFINPERVVLECGLKLLAILGGKLLLHYYGKYQEYQADMYAIENAKKHAKLPYGRITLLEWSLMFRGLMNREREIKASIPTSLSRVWREWVLSTNSFGEWFHWLDPFRTHPPDEARIRYYTEAYFAPLLSRKWIDE